jgi:hypothetical protein
VRVDKKFSPFPFSENVYVYHFQTDTRKAGTSQNSGRMGTNLPTMITERLLLLF